MLCKRCVPCAVFVRGVRGRLLLKRCVMFGTSRLMLPERGHAPVDCNH